MNRHKKLILIQLLYLLPLALLHGQNRENRPATSAQPLNGVYRAVSSNEDSTSHETAMLTLLFRVGKSDIDPNYMDNRKALDAIGRVLTTDNLKYVDSLQIVAFASPEGGANFNRQLSQRRADAVARYLTARYPAIDPSRVVYRGLGENWDGLRTLAQNDPLLPSRAVAIELLYRPMNDDLREQQLRNINGGELFKYMSAHYFDKLRVGASLSLMLDPETPAEIATTIDNHLHFRETPLPVPPLKELPAVEPTPFGMPQLARVVLKEGKTAHYRRPLALKTNLLFDLATLFNLEIEIPIYRRFSVLAEWTFPFWGGLGNAGGIAPIPGYSEKYTLQMLSGGIEGRYWFPRSSGMNKRAQRWGDYNPLNGWFVGLYGGGGVYDFQFGAKGMQGDFYIASGISTGFAHPIGKHFHLEYSLGLGYVATRYYNYSIMDGHKVVDIRADGKYDRRQQSLIGPTKLKVSLVWIPQFKTK